MNSGEKGFTLVELVFSLAVIAIVSAAASAAIFQVFKGNERNNDYLTAVHQIQSAGYWISRDAQRAQSVTTDDLTPPDFFIISWTEWDENGDPIYHSATYFFEGLTNNIGDLKRTHWSSAGANEQTLLAKYIYYDPADVDDTTKVSYQSPVLTVQLTTLFEETMESREYKITRRPNF